jgi:hypothetical protein
LLGPRIAVAAGSSNARPLVNIDSLLTNERSLSEELFARPGHLKIFVSSQMRESAGTKVFERERLAIAEAIEATAVARAWYWERDAIAGPYCSEQICVGQAATSDGLVLLLGEALTEITHKEYLIAHARKVPCYVFVDQRVTQSREVRRLVKGIRDAGPNDRAVTKGFENLSELQGHVTDALRNYAVQAVRRVNYVAWEQSRGDGAS